MANLLTIASGFTGRSPETLAEEIGSGGGRALKALLVEAINEGLRTHRDRRRRIAEERAHLLQILRAGNAKAEAVADKTLNEVRQVMAMDY